MTESPELSAASAGVPDDQVARISRLLRAQRLESVAALAGGIAHDLNNVLAAVLLAADVLAQHARAPAAERALAALDELARQGIGLTEQILFLARGVDGEATPFDLRHLIAEVRKLARVIFPPPGAVLTSYPGDLWLVSGDALLVYQLLLESCREARRSRGSLGTLRIRARNAMLDESQAGVGARFRPGPHVLVEIATEGATGGETARPPAAPDAGVGPWPPVSLRKMLEGRGAVFGLAALDRLDRASEVLRVHLPAVVQGGSAAAAPDARLAPGNGKLILVIEDDAALRVLLAGSLESHGYRVESSESGPEAVALIARHDVEVAVVTLPVGSLPEWSRQLLEAAGSRAIPVLALPGPFTVAELLLKVGQALGSAAEPPGASPI
ncbi:MAG TPA: hypothetical protein VHR45_10880 [Thermoanaerobaculia bacterium]|nr:hypothetical protein [Thermoanaerobaculia bacterium]